MVACVQNRKIPEAEDGSGATMQETGKAKGNYWRVHHKELEEETGP